MTNPMPNTSPMSNTTDFKLELCDRCGQMTNHLIDSCQKCKVVPTPDVREEKSAHRIGATTMSTLREELSKITLNYDIDAEKALITDLVELIERSNQEAREEFAKEVKEKTFIDDIGCVYDEEHFIYQGLPSRVDHLLSTSNHKE